MEVWAELRSLGLDMTFILDSLIGEISSSSLELASSSEAPLLLEEVKG
jgi:hypothetical protein